MSEEGLFEGGDADSLKLCPEEALGHIDLSKHRLARYLQGVMREIWRSRAFFRRLCREHSQAVQLEEEYEGILFDQNTYIAATLIQRHMRGEPEEVGAFVHALTVEQPRIIFTIFGERECDIDVELLPLAVEFIPSMLILLNKPSKEFTSTRHGQVITACLSMRYPTAKLLDTARGLLEIVGSAVDYHDGADLGFRVKIIRMLIRAFPQMVEPLSRLEISRMQSEPLDVFAPLSNDLCMIAEAVKKPIYRQAFTCLDYYNL